MSEGKKFYRYVDPAVTMEGFVKTLANGLGRTLTEQEARTLQWLSENDYETRGVILDIFKELVKRQGENNEH